MFRPKSMKKVRLIVLKSHLADLVRDLHEAGVVDIRKSAHEGLDEGRPLASFDDISAELLKLRTVLSLMESSLEGKDDSKIEDIGGAQALDEARTLVAAERLKVLSREAGQLSDRIRALENEALAIEKVLPFKGVDFSRLDTRTLGCRVGELSDAKAEKLKRSLEKIGGHNTLASEAGSDTTLVLYDKKNQQAVDVLLSEIGFGDIDLPPGTTTPMETINRINSENDERKGALAGIQKEMAEVSGKHIGRVKSLIRALETEADRAEVASKFASSKRAYVVEGWALAEEFGKLEKLSGKYRDVLLEDVDFGHHDTPPTVLDNPGPAAPLEFITKSYSLPNYFELDPTMAYFIGLPILYGMIVGDFLYGIASIVIGWLLMQKFKDSYMMYNVSKIWFISGFPTLIFGIIFDEFGGMSHFALLEALGKWVGMTFIDAPLYLGFHRLANVFQLVVLTVAVGLIHLGAGFVLGAINEWNHSKKHALAKIAWLGVELGLVLSLVGAIGILESAFAIAGLIVLFISVVGLVLTEGIMGIIELPGLIGNILSYTRIAAVGIVGVVIAELLNRFLIPLPEQGILAIILLPVFLALHAVNAFIAMFESLVQGGRLNIVEFRSKFLHGGGEIFSPFKMR